MYSPLLQHKNFSYTRLLAATWHTNLSTPSVCTSLAGQRLLEWMQGAPEELPFILNCSGVSVVEDHSFSQMERYLSSSKRVVAFLIYDGNDQLVLEIESELRLVKICSESVNGLQILFYGNRSGAQSLRAGLDGIVKDISDLERAFLTKAVSDCYRDFPEPERLDSTPLVASGVLNARSLISDPIKFTWISLLLTELFERVVDESRPRNNRILAVSLRGSPFAAAVRLLAHSYSPSLEVIDHIGPKHDLLEASIGQLDMYGGEYVLIGDFVIGGTELKIARTYAMSQGAVINNAIAIGSFLSGDMYDKNIRLESLVNIPDVVPQLKYEFIAQGAK